MRGLKGHTSEETAYLIEDYPWGFKLRTQVKTWIEHKPNFGFRKSTRTLNPKTNKWCKPKHSTYAPFMVLVIEEEGDENPGHIGSRSIGYWSELEKCEEFLNKYGDCLPEKSKYDLEKIIEASKKKGNEYLVG